MILRDEDAIRDGYTPNDGSAFVKGAKQLLGFDIPAKDVEQGTGQIKTFNQLGFRGVNDKPDGWYLPNDTSKVAIVLETKAEREDLNNPKWENELFKNIDIVATKYNKIVGILWNGKDIRVYKGKTEEVSTAPTLQDKSYYISLYTQTKLDKEHIYQVTQRINNQLATTFGMQDVQDRMIFTACALVAQRYHPVDGLKQLKGMGYTTLKHWISEALSNAINDDIKLNEKLNILLDAYASIKISVTGKQSDINDFIDNVCEIADLVNSDNWHGEDVMGIFFNEFSRYIVKPDAGQVFTPDHITSFMYRLLGVTMNDKVLDATCGSGAFLVKSMANMIKEAGGVATEKAKLIKSEQLFGIEKYPKIFALACANMLIHKDGKTNLAQMDARSEEAGTWIKSKGITKVLMNPPYETAFGCMPIVTNVLDNVPVGTKCAFILPDKKLDKNRGKKLLKKHTLTHIIKLPENLFFGVGVTTSLFIFETGVAQGTRNIKGYYIENDGLETVKNKGRQDVKDKWESIEDYWVKAIQDDNDFMYNTRQLINPMEHLSYQMPEKPFEIYEEDFVKTVMAYQMFQRGIDVKEFNNQLMQKVLYSSDVKEVEDGICVIIKGGE